MNSRQDVRASIDLVILDIYCASKAIEETQSTVTKKRRRHEVSLRIATV